MSAGISCTHFILYQLTEENIKYIKKVKAASLFPAYTIKYKGEMIHIASQIYSIGRDIFLN